MVVDGGADLAEVGVAVAEVAQVGGGGPGVGEVVSRSARRIATSASSARGVATGAIPRPRQQGAGGTLQPEGGWKYGGAVIGGGLTIRVPDGDGTGRSAWRTRSRPVSMRRAVCSRASAGCSTSRRCASIRRGSPAMSSSMRGRCSALVRGSSRWASASRARSSASTPSGLSIHARCSRSRASPASKPSLKLKSTYWRDPRWKGSSASACPLLTVGRDLIPKCHGLVTGCHDRVEWPGGGGVVMLRTARPSMVRG